MTTILKPWISVLLACLMVVVSTTIAQATPRIVVRETATVIGRSILLGDVADVTGQNKEQLQLLSAVRVGRAPVMIGVEERRISREWIRACLAISDIRSGEYVLTGADAVQVRRLEASRSDIPTLEVSFDLEVPQLHILEPTLYDLLPVEQQDQLHEASGGFDWNVEQLHDASETFLMEHFNLDPALVSFDFSHSLPLDIRKHLNGRVVILRVQTPNETLPVNETFECYVELLVQPFAEITQVDRIVAKVKCRATQYRQAVVAARSLQRGTVITKDDILLDVVEVHKATDVLETVESLLGLQMVSSVRPGQTLTSRDFRKAPLVLKGSWILYYYGHTDTVERVRAMSEGGLDDIIEIEVKRGTKMIRLQARVFGENKSRQLKLN